MVGQDGEINWNFTVQFYQKVGFSRICHEFKIAHNLTFPTPTILSFRPPSLQGYKFIFTTTSIRSTNYKITWRTLVRLLSRKIISPTHDHEMLDFMLLIGDLQWRDCILSTLQGLGGKIKKPTSKNNSTQSLTYTCLII